MYRLMSMNAFYKKARVAYIARKILQELHEKCVSCLKVVADINQSKGAMVKQACQMYLFFHRVPQNLVKKIKPM